MARTFCDCCLACWCHPHTESRSVRLVYPKQLMDQAGNKKNESDQAQVRSPIRNYIMMIIKLAEHSHFSVLVAYASRYSVVPFRMSHSLLGGDGLLHHVQGHHEERSHYLADQIIWICCDSQGTEHSFPIC